MGAWAADPFGNDTACDWVYDLEKTTGLSLIEETIDAVIETGDEYLEAPTAEQAIAACDAIARLQGRFYERNSYTASLDKWVERQKVIVSPELTSKAIAAIDRILTEPSELLELWNESGDNEWKEHLLELKTRVILAR